MVLRKKGENGDSPEWHLLKQKSTKVTWNKTA